MLQLLIGLALFLGIHSLQSLAPQARQNSIVRWGPLGFKAVYAAVAVLGLYLLVQGYSQARLEPVVLWTPPRGMQHATILLMWVAMVLLVASYVPGNQIKAKLRHPMTLSVKVWALGHLLSNQSGRLNFIRWFPHLVGTGVPRSPQTGSSKPALCTRRQADQHFADGRVGHGRVGSLPDGRLARLAGGCDAFHPSWLIAHCRASNRNAFQPGRCSVCSTRSKTLHRLRPLAHQ